jgi:hypothetical protein
MLVLTYKIGIIDYSVSDECEGGWDSEEKGMGRKER